MIVSGISLCKDQFFFNQSIDLFASTNAKVSYSYLLEDFSKSFLFTSFRAFLLKNSSINLALLHKGAKIEHGDYKIELKEENAKANADALFLLKEKEHSHLNIKVEHLMKNTHSNQLIKAVLKGSSRASFEGDVFLDKKAQKSSACQLNKNLLLSDSAEAFSKPFLRVFADDVKAKHGSVVFKLREEEVFYLQSRGLLKEDAKSLLIKGFCQEIKNNVLVESVKKAFTKALNEYL